jgi:hypothetical protein
VRRHPGAGISQTAFTNTSGVATFYAKPTRIAEVTFKVTKSGYATVSISRRVHHRAGPLGRLGPAALASRQLLGSDPGDGRSLLQTPPQLILAVGVPASVGLTIYAARTNRPWQLPVAMVLGSTVFWLSVFAPLAAIPRLLSSNRPDRNPAPKSSPRL